MWYSDIPAVISLLSSVLESSRKCPTLDPRVASQRWECHSLKRAMFLETNCLSMLCPTCSICWTCRFLLVPCWGLDLLQFYAILSFYFLYSSATENQLHMSRGMVPCQVLRVPHCCFCCIVRPGYHIRLPPFKPIYFPRCHNLNLISVCPCNELFVGNSFSYITVTFEMSLWLFSLSNIFSRIRENGTKSK